MAVRGNEQKRKRKRQRTNISRVDRLSSLPDDILIEIISRLPFPLAMATGYLSKRWCGLWTNVTSIHIDSNKFDCFRGLDTTTFNNIITRIASPLIHSLTVNFGDRQHMGNVQYPMPSLDYSWLRQICDRNVRELKLTNTSYYRKVTQYDRRQHVSWVQSRYEVPIFTLPSFICVTQSLVSMELDAKFKLQLPDNEVPINLPNLKKLHLCSPTMSFKSVETVIKACPSLEELSFEYSSYCSSPSFRRRNIIRDPNIIRRTTMRPRYIKLSQQPDYYIKLSHENLRRLFIKNIPCTYGFVLYVPKLEYLGIRVPKLLTVCFEEEPMVSCQAEISITDAAARYSYGYTKDEMRLMSKFYGVFCNVTIHTPYAFVLEKPSSMFGNATRLTLLMNTSHDINTLLEILKLCPVLDVLTLKIRDPYVGEWAPKTRSKDSSSILQPVLKTIKIETKWDNYCKTTKYFIDLVQYLLSNTVDLEHFHIKTDWRYHKMGCIKLAQNRERELCKLLYQCPVISAGCEVQFVGRLFNMSWKAGQNIWSSPS
ncbi:F-box/FBD/LRR-repeat protein At5g22660-like [Silene latifolia]|uniref:F-box/FBD/LRR-repeat protein At5g22660-like n=1 Tax=Silene latifolia TaxID=37657 RepID=UPI003D771F05